MSVLVRAREALLRVARRAGWAGMLGVVLIGAAFVVDVVGGAALEARRESLAAERARLLRAAPADAAGRIEARAAGKRLADFHAGFPPLHELPRTLARVHAHADHHALDLERSDYRSSDEAGTALVRVSIHLPVRGEFGQIYAWLNALLADMPEVALEALSVRRSDSEIALLDAEVRLALFVRRER